MRGAGSLLAGPGVVPAGQGAVPAGQGVAAAGQGAAPAGQGVAPAYPGCHQPMRRVSVARTRALLGRMFEGYLEQDSRLRCMVDRLVDQVRVDQGEWSDLLEPSLSVVDGKVHRGRFSYGLPGCKRDPEGTAARLEAWTQPFGPEMAAWVRRLSPAFGHAAVAHPIFGLSYSGPDLWRVKLYLQFEAGADAAARRLAWRVLGGASAPVATRLLDRAGAGELHLLGLDLRPGGIALAKLYFWIREADLFAPAALPSPVGSLALLGEMAAAGLERLQDLLVIYRLRGPEAPDGLRPAQIDFSLLDNDLVWSELLGLPSLAGCGIGEPWEALAGEFRLLGRRLSVGLGTRPKVTLYYGLAEPELDPETEHDPLQGPSGGGAGGAAESALGVGGRAAGGDLA